MTELKHLEDLCSKATPGPWKGDEYEMTAPKVKTLEEGRIKLVWADDYHMSEFDAEFIAAARTALPELIARVRRLEAEIVQFKEDRYPSYAVLARIEHDNNQALYCLQVEKIKILSAKLADMEEEARLTNAFVVKQARELKDATEALERITDATPSMGRPEFTMYDLRDIARTCLARIKWEG